MPPDSISGSDWSLTDAGTASRLRKMEAASVPLEEYVKGQIYRGLLTGFNKAFVIDGAKREELVSQEPTSADLIKPLAVGTDVRKWRIDKKDKWLIVTPIGVDIDRYPAIFEHLSQWQPELEKRYDKGNHWWELRACDYYDAFEEPKILFPDIAKESRFTLDAEKTYTTNTTYFIPSHDLYLLGILNSNIMWGYAKERLTVVGDADKSGRLRFFRQFVQKLPVPEPHPAERDAIAELVQDCLDLKGVDCEDWEQEIDERVASLYGLDDRELGSEYAAG